MALLSTKGRPNPYPINYWRLTAIIFFVVSGGPGGTENLVSAGGPLLALLSILVASWLWSVPEASITTELSLVFPTNAGFAIWIHTAFGAFWGFYVWYLSFITGVLTMSVYPLYLMNFVVDLIEPSHVEKSYDGWPKYLAAPAIVVLCSILAWRGLRFSGNALFWVAMVVVVPWAIWITYGIINLNAYRWVQAPAGGWDNVDWGSMLNTLFWSLNFWETASCLSGEIEDINSAFPTAMATDLWLATLLVGLAILVGTGATDYSQSEWRGQMFYATVAGRLCGSWLWYGIVVACALSAVGQFVAELVTTAYQTAGMADKGLLPSLLSRRNDFGAPVWPLAISGVLSLVVALVVHSYADLFQIMAVVNVIYGVAELILFVGFIKLRLAFPEFNRPYRVPLETWGCVLLVLPPTAFVGALWAFSTAKTWIISAPLILLGVLLYPLRCAAESRGWFSFEDVDPMVYPWMEHDKGMLAASDESLGRTTAIRVSESESQEYYKGGGEAESGDSVSLIAKA
jgi:amino acid transporter